MPETKRTLSDPARFLDAAGVTHRMVQFKAGHIFFSQGGPATSIFFLDSGRAKLVNVVDYRPSPPAKQRLYDV